MSSGENQKELSALEKGLPCGNLIIKIARSPEEKEAVYELRFRVFNEELGEGIPENKELGLDFDEFDAQCDHLMVISHGQVVGTYRVLFGPRRPARGFYTQTEFELSKLPVDFDQTVELGRGCIEPAHRKQTTLMALFWGLHRYMIARGARYLMGCGSLPPMTADDAEATFKALQHEGRVLDTPDVYPHPSHAFSGEASKGSSQVPQLISLYLEFGAKVFGRPAYDPIFRCYDLLLVFDMDHLSEWGSELLARFDKRLANRGEEPN